jgi:hypothetical protein
LGLAPSVGSSLGLSLGLSALLVGRESLLIA